MLCRMDTILKAAKKEGFAVPAPNVWNLETIQKAIQIAEEEHSPIILDYGEGGDERHIFEIALISKYYGERSTVPVAINLDHGETFEGAIRAIKAGFTSVMVDRSSLPFEDNLRETKEICKIAHAADVSVESELGHVGYGYEYEETRNSGLTDPNLAKQFAEESETDCLAVSIGTSHGTYKGTPYLDFDLLTKLNESLTIPLVLHGGSGTGDDNLKKAISIGIQKINLYTDLSIAAIDCFDKNYIENKISKDLYDIMELPYNAYGEKLRYYCKLFGSSGRI